jgi:hypothetical protein
MSWRREDSRHPGNHRPTADDRRIDREFRQQQHEREMEETRRDIDRAHRELRSLNGHTFPIRQAR